MRDSVSYGTLMTHVCELPKSVAKAWLDYLGEDERLNEREYISLDYCTQITGQLQDLVIYRSSQSYFLSINPEED